MEKILKNGLALVLVLVMVVSMAACGAKAADTTTESTGDASKSVKEATVTFLDTMPSPERKGFFDKMIERYQKENPGIKIEYNTVPWDEAYKKVVAMGASKSLPDINTGDVGIMTALANNEALIDLTEKFKSMPTYGDLNAATKASESTYSFKGKIYSIPDGFLSQGIFVRNDLMSEKGYKVEDLQQWTWDDYDKVVKDLTNAEKTKFGMAFRGGNNGLLRLFEYFGSMLEETEMFPYGDNRSLFEAPGALELFKRFYSNYTEGYSPKDSINWAFKEQVEGFVNGQCATLNQTPEVIITCEDSMKKDTWTVLPQPVKPDAKIHSYTWGVTASYMISQNSKNQDAAWDFVEWTSSPEINIEYCKTFLCAPLYNSAMKDTFFSEGYMKAYAKQMSDSKVKFLEQPSWLSQWGYFLSEFGKVETQKYMAGEQTAEQTLSNLAKWMRDNYDKDIANKQ
ncbi:MAG: ABC transporter substrate-binding protein [Ruminiclostridium sp.]